MNEKLSLGLKIWLYILFVGRIIGACIYLFVTIKAFLQPDIYLSSEDATIYGILMALLTLVGIAMVVAIGFMLFKKKIKGFNFFVLAILFEMILSIILKLIFQEMGSLFSSIVAAVIPVLITYFFARQDISDRILE